MFSTESPHRGDSNEYTKYTIVNIKKNQPELSRVCIYGIFSKGLKSEFETTVVNEPSVFEPLKVCCITLVERVILLLHKMRKIQIYGTEWNLD